MDGLTLSRNKTFWILATFIVLLLLLAFYVIDGINQEEKAKIHESSINLPGNDQFYFGSYLIPFSDITSKVEQFDKTSDGNQLLHIRSAKFIEMSTIVSVIKAIQKAGHQRIGLPTKFEKKHLWFCYDLKLVRP